MVGEYSNQHLHNHCEGVKSAADCVKNSYLEHLNDNFLLG
ncbi:hypothetical protein PRUB_a2076 [Pseudoalteromonas rubra]|uniref:Uncharacterized protein n=1 Tax=Pseudoalteromonas rubra TaxID=43658 RepID=A0A8T0CDU7_9GAMM|nr:hypothetical protein PRUB_a2076 [Pseudoalteromonas rubra]